jgi:hypothetical protein
LQCDKGHVSFSPTLKEAKDLIIRCLQEIVLSTKEFPRIEHEIFPETRDMSLHLHSVEWNEDHVQSLVTRATDIFSRNAVGPMKYTRMYSKYSQLLTADADRERDAFLKSNAALAQFQEMMDKYDGLKKEIRSIRNSALLNLFVLDCTDLNRVMVEHCQQLYDSLISFQVNTNRTWNRNICNQVLRGDLGILLCLQNASLTLLFATVR